MTPTFDDVLKIAMDLSPGEVSAAWEAEIQRRVRAIDEGRVIGIPHEVVMREMKEWLNRSN